MTTATVEEARVSAAERDGIMRLVHRYSIEVSMRDPNAIDECASNLPPGSDVYISMLPGQTYHGTVTFAARLRHAGFNPVPHVAARNLASVEAAADYFARAAGEAGVTQMLAIGGDRQPPAGPFDSSVQLIETGLFARYGIRRVGIAGYPEEHPKVASPLLDAALCAKQTLGHEHGLDLYIVTQFCFDAPAIEAWVQHIGALALGLPIRIGLAGPASIATLLKFAAHCGVKASMRGLTSRSTSLVRMLTEAGPEKIVRRLAQFASVPEGSAIAGCHFYAFGAAVRTTRWAQSIAAGQFDVPAHSEGFTVGARV